MTSGGKTSSGTYGGRPGSRISGGVFILGLRGSKKCLGTFITEPVDVPIKRFFVVIPLTVIVSFKANTYEGPVK